MTSSSDSSEPLDLDRLLPVTAEDTAAQRRLREQSAPMTFPEYLDFLSRQPPPSHAELRARRGPRGEPFVLEF